MYKNYSKELKLVCKYYPYLLGVIKNLKEYNSKKRGRYTGQLKNNIRNHYFSNQLEELWEIIYELMYDNYDSFVKGKKRNFKKNIWNIIKILSEQLKGKSASRDLLGNLNNLIQSKYKCSKLSKLRHYSIILVLDTISYIKNTYKIILLIFIVASLSAYLGYRFGSNTINTNTDIKNNSIYTQVKLANYTKKYLSKNEIRFLVKNDKLFKNIDIVKFKSLSGTYIKYKSSLYNIDYLFKTRIGNLCRITKNINYCYFNIDKICENTPFWINTIKKYENTSSKEIRISLIYIKFMLSYKKCKM